MDINISPYEEDTSLYSVERAVIESKKGDYTCFLILRDRLPATDLNKHLILKQKKSAHPCSTGAYVIASLLNEMYDRGLEIEDITRGHIFDYLTEAYVEEGKAYKTILSYITIIGDLFDDLHVHGIPIHSSLLMTDKNALYILKNKKERRCITTIPLMRKEFLPNKNAVISNSMFSYTKWYTKDQIDALAEELPLVYRCIFLDTVMTGHRVDSALSITTMTYNAKEQYMSQENNTVTYLINGTPVSFCTSSRALTLNAQTIHDAVRTLQEALAHSQIEMLDPVIGLLGGKAVLSIMATLYMDQSKELLISYARKQYVEKRELPTPRKLFKSVFHNSLPDLTPAYELLAAVENVIPEAADYLIQSSATELMSDKSQWILYYLRANNPFRRTVAFHHSEGINQEVRNFLRDVAQIRITSQTECVVLVHDNWYYIESALRILTESGVHLNSILDIQPTDCLYLQSCLAQRSEYKEKTQRHIIQVMMRFYSFTAKRSGITGKSPFDYIHLPKQSEGKHTPPITAEALELIKDRISSLPVHFRIAFTIAVLTGARASSICLLTTDAIVHKEDGYELIIQHKKTEIRHTMSNRPTYTLKKLSGEFVQFLHNYIESTKEIRSKLDVPYLLVYYPPNYRTGSKRPPAVLTPSTFADQIAKLMRDTPLYRTDGTPVKCNFMSIRAEFGRAMFASGATADDVARALGNTAPVAATNYNTMSAKDEAELYHQHYDAAFAPMREQIKARYEKEENVILLSDHISPKPVMYGNCTSNDNKQCNKNNCDECPQRIVCRQEREVVMR